MIEKFSVARRIVLDLGLAWSDSGRGRSSDTCRTKTARRASEPRARERGNGVDEKPLTRIEIRCLGRTTLEQP